MNQILIEMFPRLWLFQRTQTFSGGAMVLLDRIQVEIIAGANLTDGVNAHCPVIWNI